MACLIDTHNHMQSEQFDHDRPDVFRRAKESGVGCALIAAEKGLTKAGGQNP